MAEPWPGESHRSPHRGQANWALRAPLARWVEEQATGAAARHGRLRVLDVGCGFKPYYPFFAPYAERYVGVDSGENASADLVGAAESLPVEDASFDIVLCTQVLEHADDPAQVVAELSRVTVAGGTVLASTHGVQVYHPSPVDLWRWTHEGLRRLFSTNGSWSSVAVTPGAGTAATLAMLLATYVDLAAQRLHLVRAAGGAIWLLNALGAWIDGRSRELREPGPGSLIANFHVVALKA
jgi:SAM-dependent methyltransferase